MCDQLNRQQQCGGDDYLVLSLQYGMNVCAFLPFTPTMDQRIETKRCNMKETHMHAFEKIDSSLFFYVLLLLQLSLSDG